MFHLHFITDTLFKPSTKSIVRVSTGQVNSIKNELKIQCTRVNEWLPFQKSVLQKFLSVFICFVLFY